jgi:hypothetical protein
VSPDFLDLKRRTQDNLFTFLNTEAELASTFCDMAERTQNPEHRVQLLSDIRKAVSAMRHFEGRITDRSIRAYVVKKANRLDAFLARFSK